MKILISTGSKELPYRAALEALNVEVIGGYLPACDESCDALILCGGSDIDPALYGEAMRGSESIDAMRDETEWRLLSIYRERPILGICRGLQVLNAYFGGTLHQDIPDHRAEKDSGAVEVFHRALTVPGTRAARLFGAETTVNSSHHQSVDRLAEGFRVTMTAPDGTVEAIEHETKPILALQWHPERMLASPADYADGARVFRELLAMLK